MNKLPLPETIEGVRTILRRHESAFAPAMFKSIDEGRERLARFLPWVPMTRTAEDSLAFIADSGRKWEALEQFAYAVFPRDEGVFAGNIALFAISWPDARGEIGYWMGGGFEGRGLMTDAVKALESVAFGLGFHRLEIRCDPVNIRSISIPQRLGYGHDGTLREDKFIDGAYRDTLVFGKLSPPPGGA